MNGAVQDDGHVDPGAHFYKALMVDAEGQAIHRRNAQDIVTAVYVRTIGPGTADVAHYSFKVPEDYVGRKLTLRARLLWRKFDRAYTEFAFNNNRQGFRRFDQVPDLPVTEIARSEVELVVGGPSAHGCSRMRATGCALMTMASACCFKTIPRVLHEPLRRWNS